MWAVKVKFVLVFLVIWITCCLSCALLFPRLDTPDALGIGGAVALVLAVIIVKPPEPRFYRWFHCGPN
jgi:hypothetical protein